MHCPETLYDDKYFRKFKVLYIYFAVAVKWHILIFLVSVMSFKALWNSYPCFGWSSWFSSFLFGFHWKMFPVSVLPYRFFCLMSIYVLYLRALYFFLTYLIVRLQWKRRDCSESKIRSIIKISNVFPKHASMSASKCGPTEIWRAVRLAECRRQELIRGAHMVPYCSPLHFSKRHAGTVITYAISFKASH
jgi:hypothetical protein